MENTKESCIAEDKYWLEADNGCYNSFQNIEEACAKICSSACFSGCGVEYIRNYF